jgi:nuclear pore complex protein Nup133
LFKQLVKNLLTGKALSIEDMVDLLTLKDNTDGDAPVDYATALHLLAQAKDLPAARQQAAFCSVWRRVYTHDKYVRFLWRF